MERDLVCFKIFSILKEILDDDFSKIKESTSFDKDLKFDSLDSIELIIQIEDEFKIELDDEEIEKVETIKDLINYVQLKVNEQ